MGILGTGKVPEAWNHPEWRRANKWFTCREGRVGGRSRGWGALSTFLSAKGHHFTILHRTETWPNLCFSNDSCLCKRWLGKRWQLSSKVRRSVRTSAWWTCRSHGMAPQNTGCRARLIYPFSVHGTRASPSRQPRGSMTWTSQDRHTPHVLVWGDKSENKKT